MTVDMRHMEFIQKVSEADCATLRRKEATYQGSWKRRGGVGAFMMLARKWDRLENMMQCDNIRYDIFEAIVRTGSSGGDGTALAEIRDLRQYLLLVEAEMLARVPVPIAPSATARQLADAANPEKHTDFKPLGARGAEGIGKDGEAICVGDFCTWMDPKDNQCHDARLLSVELGVPRVLLTGANATIPVEWNQLRLDTMRTRRVPRYDDASRIVPESVLARHAALAADTPSCGDGLADTHARQRTAEDGAQHASLAPWVVRGRGYFENNVSQSDLAARFWNRRGQGTFVLEPHVESTSLPKVLARFYRSLTSASWIVRVELCPPDARQFLPSLPRELNAMERDERPEWQHHLYEWRETENKFRLREYHAAWHAEAE